MLLRGARVIDAKATLRNVAVVGCALAISALVLRPQVSSALVTRGDELSLRGDAARARVLYRRAYALDNGNLAALDRFAFAAMMSHDRSQVAAAIGLVTSRLGRDGDDANLRMDLALCEQDLNMRREAERDFERIGMQRHDARALTFAALDTSNMPYSRALLARAIAYDPGFLPARRDLARLRRREQWRK